MTRTFAERGAFIIGLRVTDADGAATTVRRTFNVGSRPPVATFTVSDETPILNQDVTLTAAPTDPDGDAIASLAWDLDDDGAFDDGTSATAHVSFPAGGHLVGLKVRDALGDTGIRFVRITVARHRDADAHADRDADGDSDRDADCDSDRDADCDSDCDSDSDCDGDADGYGDGYGDCHRHRRPDARIDRDTRAPADPECDAEPARRHGPAPALRRPQGAEARGAGQVRHPGQGGMLRGVHGDRGRLGRQGHGEAAQARQQARGRQGDAKHLAAGAKVDAQGQALAKAKKAAKKQRSVS